MSAENRKDSDLLGVLPGVSVIVVCDDNEPAATIFEECTGTCSLGKLELVFVREIVPQILDGAHEEFVAFARANTRYVNDYALELLANTARLEGLDVTGGIEPDGVAKVSDFIFRTSWLREHAGLLEILRRDEQAFVAGALAKAGRHSVAKRTYTEELRIDSSPLVSVVVPVYNTEKYLDRCMASIVAQTHRNLEIIIVDDGSTDSSPQMADKWAGADKRIKVVHKANGGQSSARNAGMRIATGKYVGFVDSDDYVEMDMFGDLAQVLESHPLCDVAKCAVAVEYTYDVSERERKSTESYLRDPVKGEVRPGGDVVADTDVCPVDKLYRLDFLRNNGIEFPEGTKNEDEAFFFEVFCRVRNCYYLPKKYYRYLRNEGGTMAKQQNAAEEGKLPDAVRVFSFIAELLERENRRDLLGALYRHMVGLVQRFRDTAVEDAVSDCIAGILRRTNAFYYADTIYGSDRTWVTRRVFELMNRRTPERENGFRVPREWFPKSVGKEIRASASPVVSFIVPVYNAEKYIAAALESLRRQTFPDFEVVCVDDGSIDDSGKILDFYAGIDSRIKVWHNENGGVSKARNFGLAKASGKYVAFMDGDDKLHPRMAAATLMMAARDRLDAVMFDYRCFACDTLKPIDHYWRLAKHVNAFPRDRVFAPSDATNIPIYGSCCVWLWDRNFLSCEVKPFPGIKLGEDLAWVLDALSKVRRMRVLNAPFYEYRRGNPSSAVSRLQTKACDAPVQALAALAGVFAKTTDRRWRAMLVRRMISDILFYGERMPLTAQWLRNEGFEAFGGMDFLKHVCPDKASRLDAIQNCEVSIKGVDIETFIRMAPPKVQRLMRDAIAARKGTRKDMIIVAGQLNSTTNEAIDSWTFFRWLQENGVPSRYVVWRKHLMVSRLRSERLMKDVILLDGNGVDDFEFIEKCRDLMPRLRAVVMENVALNPVVWRFLNMLDGCGYVFLQHGVMFWKMAPKIASAFSVANFVNVASVAEKEFLEKYVPEHPDTRTKPEYIIAGLPRWDLLRDESAGEREKVVFFMPTWRAAFNSGMETISRSAYLTGIQSLVSGENIERLKRRGIRIVVAAHHHLAAHVKDLDFGLAVEIAKPSEISYWIRHASLCVTDYSSVCFDFLFLGKPCIFWTSDRYDGLLDGDDYSEVVFAASQGRHLFNRVDSASEVIEAIERYAAAGFVLEPEKRAVADKYFTYRSDICRHLYEEICKAVPGGKEIAE